MQTSKISVDKNLQETIKHGTSALPIAVYTDNFELFDDGYIRLYWHNDLQFSYVLSEKIVFFIYGKELLLNPCEGILINSNILHEIKPYKENCRMFTINFDPFIIGGTTESIVQQKYVQPFLKSSHIKYIILNRNVKWQKIILDYMYEIFELSNSKSYLYELNMINNLNLIWFNLMKEIKDKIKISKNILHIEN
ncbi:AraC family ligand binding domain-containing protein [uncultured Clostridium sp.]|uniref:AraC family ligand binding domain-containing protein n=1 Tax=uncultured Clostridium sp. TaxID=59620 RepID=UPI0025F38D11|nr:AraC family ligand binding domain-containing protein [uncultured Clostridium sp.]